MVVGIAVASALPLPLLPLQILYLNLLRRVPPSHWRWAKAKRASSGGHHRAIRKSRSSAGHNGS